MEKKKVPKKTLSTPSKTEDELHNLQSKQTVEPKQPAKPPRLPESYFLSVLVTALLLLLLFITGTFIGYQSERLKQRPYRVQPPLIQPASPTPPQEPNGDLASWKTYSSDTFEFKYPKDWAIQENPLKLIDPTNALIISIASFNPAIVGINYCDAYLQEEPTRCERLTTRNASATIDWGDEGSPQANAIFNFNGIGLSVTLETNPDIPARTMLTAEDQDFFRTFLSTFQFLDDNNETTQPITGEGCVIGGCNGELCQDADEEPLSSICIFRPEYICYKSATCELQNDGKCGWTQTEELQACLAQY